MAQQFNDPQCRKAADPAHRCTDKHGHWFASPLRAARPGTTCWWEQMQRLEETRKAVLDDLAKFAADVQSASTLDELVRL
jgi:hypothetical protein